MLLFDSIKSIVTGCELFQNNFLLQMTDGDFVGADGIQVMIQMFRDGSQYTYH